MRIYESILIFLTLFSSAGSTYAHGEDEDQLNLDQASYFADQFGITGNNFGAKSIKPSEKLDLSIEVVNKGVGPVTISSVSESGRQNNLNNFFLSLDERSSTCFNKQILAVNGSCNFILNIRPDSQEKIFNKRLVIRYIDDKRNLKEQEFIINGNLKVELNTALLGVESSDSSTDTKTDVSAPVESKPTITYALASDDDPWFPYLLRPSKEDAAQKNLYPDEVLQKIPGLTRMKGAHVPWTFSAQPEGPKELQKLVDLVPDRIVDPATGKRYVKLYHGTTDDIIDIFKPGEKAIRFDVAVTTVLGQGFYLAADPNEAKAYACNRLKERLTKNPDLKGMMLVVGVEEKDFIKGKYSLKAHLSNDKTGEPLDPEIFFKRNGRMNNQFVFFSNTAPYLKMFEIVVLPAKKGFGRSMGIDDFDGIPQREKSKVAGNKSFTCPY